MRACDAATIRIRFSQRFTARRRPDANETQTGASLSGRCTSPHLKGFSPLPMRYVRQNIYEKNTSVLVCHFWVLKVQV